MPEQKMIQRKHYVVIRYESAYDEATDSVTEVDESVGYLIGSLCGKDNPHETLHAPVLDIDLPITGKTFATGETLLIFDKKADYATFKKLVNCLIEAEMVKPSWREVITRDYRPCGCKGNECDCPTGIQIEFSVPIRLVPSTTKGHFHLYVEHAITWKKYRTILKSLHKTGIIETNFYRMCVSHKQSFVLKPGTKKQALHHPIVVDGD